MTMGEREPWRSLSEKDASIFFRSDEQGEGALATERVPKSAELSY